MRLDGGDLKDSEVIRKGIATVFDAHSLDAFLNRENVYHSSPYSHDMLLVEEYCYRETIFTKKHGVPSSTKSFQPTPEPTTFFFIIILNGVRRY